MTDRVQELWQLGRTGLARLVASRPDVLRTPRPRTVVELAQRLDSSGSLRLALDGLDVPALQVLVAAVALDDGVSRARLRQLLGGAGAVDRVIDRLIGLALLTGSGDDVSTPPGVRAVMPDPLGLGPTFRDLAEIFTHRDLQQAERALGLPRQASKWQTAEALAKFYGDVERVRDLAGTLPRSQLVRLVARAYGGRDDDEEGMFDPRQWELDTAAVRAAVEIGLMLGDTSRYWGAQNTRMPAEVALALRGEDYRIPFNPDPPQVAWLPVSGVEQDAAAAVSAFDAAALAVLDQAARKPIAVVVAGGVGAREITRIAKSTMVSERDVRVILELASAAGLLTASRPITVDDSFAAWREAEPVDRYVVLARAWWTFVGTPSESREPDGSARRALSRRPCEGCRLARTALLSALEPARGLSALDGAQLATWHSPTCHAGDPPFEAVWNEAVLVGAVAQGALTPIGAALLAGDIARLRTAAAAALPAATHEATFGSDLTVVVAGSPSSQVARLLDAAGDRESGGGAVTWRMSRQSVRRALDDGWTVDALRGALREIAAGDRLPSALDVLLSDVGRTHGRVQVHSASSVLVGVDPADVAELAHDRKLRAAGLVAVTPTVLTSTMTPTGLVAALRKAGYMPAWRTDDDAAPVLIGGAVRRMSSDRDDRAVPSDVDIAAFVTSLLAAPDVLPERSSTEAAIADQVVILTDDEIHVLADAVDRRAPVEIVYEASTGGVTERVVIPRLFEFGHIHAWCRLRDDEREFAVARVLAVRAV